METLAKPRIAPALVLALGIVAVSMGSILARLAQEEHVPSLVIAAYRTAVAALVLLPLLLARHRQEVRALELADWRLALLSGLLLAVHFATWISSLAYTSVASSTVLVSTSNGSRLARSARISIAGRWRSRTASRRRSDRGG